MPKPVSDAFARRIIALGGLAAMLKGSSAEDCDISAHSIGVLLEALVKDMLDLLPEPTTSRS